MFVIGLRSKVFIYLSYVPAVWVYTRPFHNFYSLIFASVTVMFVWERLRALPAAILSKALLKRSGTKVKRTEVYENWVCCDCSKTSITASRSAINVRSGMWLDPRVKCVTPVNFTCTKMFQLHILSQSSFLKADLSKIPLLMGLDWIYLPSCWKFRTHQFEMRLNLYDCAGARVNNDISIEKKLL